MRALIERLGRWLSGDTSGARAYIDGYDWAAGVLLRGDESPRTVMSYLDYGALTRFDDGVIAAITDVVHMTGIVDDRVW